MGWAEKVRKEIGQNIDSTNKLIGLSKKQLYEIVGLAEPTLTKVLRGNKKYYIDYLSNMAFIFGMRLDEITDQKLFLPHNYREFLINYHKAIGSDAYLALNQRPSISYALERILDTDFLNQHVKIGEIKSEIEKILGHTYNVSSLSTEINNFQDKLTFKADPKNKNHLLYRKKEFLNTQSSRTESIYLPVYIRMCRSLKTKITFELLDTFYSLLTFLLKTQNPVLLTKVMNQIYHTDTLEDSPTDYKTLFSSLEDAGLIILSKSGKNLQISITEKGRRLIINPYIKQT